MNDLSRIRSSTAIIIAISATIVIFAADWWTTSIVNLSIFYGVVIVLLAWSESLRWMWAMTLVTALLTIFCLGVDSPLRSHSWIETTNRYITVSMLATTAAFVHFSIILGRKLKAEVAERKMAEESLRERQAELAHIGRVTVLGELGASIAHEISQPLSGVGMNSNASLRWLATDPPNLVEAREAIQRTIRDADLASGVIQRIRALLKKAPIQKTPVNINEIVQEVISLCHGEINRKDILVRAELTPNLPVVNADRIQLQQVLMNLMLNAVDAMSDIYDRPRELILRTRPEANGKVLVSVIDRGKGFGTADPQKVFDSFYTTKKEGMGMGLAISRSIIEDHQGRLWAGANEGPGAIFQFLV